MSLVQTGKASLVGPIRQEVLSGVRRPAQFEQLRERLSAFPDLPIQTKDYEQAAHFFNHCRSKGIAGTPVDLLLCAIAHRYQISLFTTDDDFNHYARHLPIRCYSLPE